MVKSVETQGTTIDAAIQSALALLKMDRDDVTVEVLENPKSGFLGIGASAAKVRVSFVSSPVDTARGFAAGVLQRMGLPAEITVAETDKNSVRLQLHGDNMGIVIGRRGETLDALQYITSLVANKGSEEYFRVTLDTENYRQKREDSLRNLAKKLAARVLKYKKSLTLEPMNPYERRIIHASLQDFKGVSTSSVGVEPNRRVVISLAGADHRKEIPGKNYTRQGRQ